MEIPKAEDSYENAKQKAKLFYASLGQIWCPVLGGFISFNRAGLRHLIGRGRRVRSRSDQRRRFSLLYFASDVVSSPSACLVYKEGHFPRIRFWAITGQHNRQYITVVIRQVGEGNKHFFSIYNQKIAH